MNRQRRHRVSVPQLLDFGKKLARRLRIRQEFVLILTNDRTLRRLNRDFRQKDKATDILSFPIDSAGPAGAAHLDNPCLGDMIVSVETAYRQAFERNHSLERELRILMIHGLLHLLGYDHETDQGQMRRKELSLQRELL